MLNKILQELQNNHVFLTGSAGTGKSFLTNRVIDEYKLQSKEVISLGSTGISAVNIGGMTIHSFFVFGISSSLEELVYNDKRNKKRLNELKKILQSIDLIVIDEISMVSADLLDMIRYRIDSMEFKGKILFVGDFFQLPPVSKRANTSNLFSNRLYAFESESWSYFAPKTIELTDIKRTKDKEFAKILSQIRFGICNSEVMEYLYTLYHNQDIYKNEPTYLFGRNIEVDMINQSSIEELNGKEYCFYTDVENSANIDKKRLNNWVELLPISRELTLKAGVPVLFTVNKWGRFMNGERGVVKVVEDDFVVVEKSGEYIRVEKHEFEMQTIKAEDDGKIIHTTLATAKQFPLKPAYAVTIHKSQGMSIDRLVCNVDYIFAPSQFYVAISRAVTPKNLKIDYNRGNFESYIKRVIRVDNRVKEFYQKMQDENSYL